MELVSQNAGGKKREGTPSLFRHFAQKFDRPSTCVSGRISIIPHPQQFVNRQFQQKIKPTKSHNCATLPIDNAMGVWYTIIVKGRGSKPIPPMYYGKDAIKPIEKIFQNFLKNPLTTDPRCAIMSTSNERGTDTDGKD